MKILEDDGSITERHSKAYYFREQHLEDGFELIDITPHCEAKIQCHGDCGGLDEPEENIYHIQVWYRDEIIAVFQGDSVYNEKTSYVIDDERYALFIDDGDFILFRKVPVEYKKNSRNGFRFFSKT